MLLTRALFSLLLTVPLQAAVVVQNDLPAARLSVPFDEGVGNPAFTGSEGSGTASCTDLGWATSPNAGDFNATTSVCDVGTIVDRTATYTITACIQPDTFGENSAGRIIDKESAGSNSYTLTLQDANDSVQSYVFGSTGQDNFDSPTNSIVPSGTTWYHIVAAFSAADTDAPSAQLYINGAAVTTTLSANTKSGNPTDGAFPFHIGNRSGGDRTFDGRINRVNVYGTTFNALQAEASESLSDCGDLAALPAVTETTCSTLMAAYLVAAGDDDPYERDADLSVTQNGDGCSTVIGEPTPQ